MLALATAWNTCDRREAEPCQERYQAVRVAVELVLIRFTVHDSLSQVVRKSWSQFWLMSVVALPHSAS